MINPRAHPLRVIARLDVKGRQLVKGINLEGLRVIGDPLVNLNRYMEMGVDEVVIFDVNASLYGFDHDYEYLSMISQNVDIPITAGGGVSSIRVFEEVLNAGADKVAINTAFTKSPDFISECADVFGSQAVVVSIEAKLQRGGNFDDGTYRAYTENGRCRTKWVVEDWVKTAQDKGAGEILLTSVDTEGRERGLDNDLIRAIAPLTRVPLQVCGGYGQHGHLDILQKEYVDAVVIAAAFHYGRATLADVKEALRDRGMTVRL